MRNSFRKIVVNEIGFHWMFHHIIKIRPDHQRQNKLDIDFGYYDSWLFVNDKENEPADYEPKVITPAFIRKCIEEAINMGWNPDLKSGLFKLKYHNKTFIKDNNHEAHKI
ncbi:hypothetical protein ACTS94_01430 [Empedobacter falsenii]